MTNSPATQSASLQLTPGAVNADAQGAANEKLAWTGVLQVKGREFALVTRLSALDMVLLQEAQDSGQLRELITAIARLVQKDQREALAEFFLSDPDDDDDRVTLDDALEALSNGLEQIAARPTDK